MIASEWTKRRCDQVLLGLLIGGLLCAIITVVIWLKLMAGYEEVAETAQHRTSLYLRASQREESLQTELASPALNDFIKQNYLTGEAPGVAYAGLQQQIKEIIESAGGVALSTQLVQEPQDQELATEKIIVRVRMNGDSRVLQKIVHALEVTKPLLFFDQLTINTPPNLKPEVEERLDIRFDIYAYFWKEKV